MMHPFKTSATLLLFCCSAAITAVSADSYDVRLIGREILTPQPGVAPQINGPVLYGARTDKPFVYRIPTAGERPIRASSSELGLSSPQSGRDLWRQQDISTTASDAFTATVSPRGCAVIQFKESKKTP